jgi:hypothetical protein
MLHPSMQDHVTLLAPCSSPCLLLPLARLQTEFGIKLLHCKLQLGCGNQGESRLINQVIGICDTCRREVAVWHALCLLGSSQQAISAASNNQILMYHI